MPRPANPKTTEGVAISRAIPASGYTQAQLAEKLDVTPGFISQFASGHRPVPWEKAAALGPLLNIDPAEISVEYRRIQGHFGASQLRRLDAGTILRTIQRIRETTKQVEGKPIDVEADPELFAEMLRLTIMETSEEVDGEQRVWAATGQGGRVAGTESQAKAGDAKGAARGRGRKSA